MLNRILNPVIGAIENTILSRPFGRSADAAFSTLTTSAYSRTIAQTATQTATFKDSNDVALEGVNTTGVAYRVTVNVDQSQISTDSSIITADGVNSVNISISAKSSLEDPFGEPLSLIGLAPSDIVISVTGGTGNVVTQPVTPTDDGGNTSGSFTTTSNGTKTISVAIRGVTLTSTASVIAGGSVSGDSFTDNFSAGVRTNANGFVWASTANGARVFVSSSNPRPGQTHSLHFKFGPDAASADSSAEARFNFGRDVPHLWYEYYLYVPSNYIHRAQPGEGVNNKWHAFWRDAYSDVSGGTWRVFQEFSRGSDTASTCRTMSSRWDFNSATDSGLPFAANGSTIISPSGPVTIGAWTQVRFEIASASGPTATDGIYRIWFDGVLFGEMTNGKFWNFDTGSGSGVDAVLKQGYLWGWSNSGFTDETILQVSELAFYFTDPGW